MLEFLPLKIKDGLSHLNARMLYEIRLRAGKPVQINYGGEYLYLGEIGVVERSECPSDSEMRAMFTPDLLSTVA